MVCLIHQTNYLLDQLLRQLEQAFLKEGGLRERMTRARLAEVAAIKRLHVLDRQTAVVQGHQGRLRAETRHGPIGEAAERIFSSELNRL